MKLYHTSPDPITCITSSFDNEFQGALFFSATPYFMSRASKYVYEIEVSDDQILEVCYLDYDQDIIDEIKERFNTLFDADIDDDDAHDYLIEDKGAYDIDTDDHESCGLFSWFIQGIQAKCARKEKYLGVESDDEQGTVYIINLVDKEALLKDVTTEYFQTDCL